MTDTLVNADELAALVRMSRRWVFDRAEDGTIKRVARGKFRLGDALPELIAYMSDGDIGEELNRQRIRKVKADADMAELEVAKAKRLVAPLEKISRAQSIAYAMILQNMRTIPSRVPNMIVGEKNERRIADVLKAEIEEGLKRSATAITDNLQDELKNPEIEY